LATLLTAKDSCGQSGAESERIMVELQAERPLVAVVTPVYNGDPYLERTLACVQAQTYPNLVHVVLDNASTDNTPRVIAKTRGGRVSILTRRNASALRQVENWNAAVAMTPPEARYIKLLPADDLIRADCIEKLVAVAESDPQITVVTAVDVFADQCKPHGLDPRKTVYEGRQIARRLMCGDLLWMPVQHVFFRATPERIKTPFPSDIERGFDGDFFYRLLIEGRMGFVNTPLFYTRVHPATVTAGLVSEGSMLSSDFHRFDRFGEALLVPAKLRAQRRAYVRKVLRHVLVNRAMARPHTAAALLQDLAKLGVRPTSLDYLAAVATWPSHKLYKSIREMVDRIVSPPIMMTEAEFLAASPPPPKPAGAGSRYAPAKINGPDGP
jgi:glycosyltransferase involved in cell wall biosynthesis